MEWTDRIFVAGHRGMVGSAILRKLKKQGFRYFVLRTSEELDLRDQLAVRQFFKVEQPDYVFMAAARVGGIYANNTYRAQFIYDNICMQTNVIDSAYRYAPKKLLSLGSSCIYPKMAPQPIREEYLLTGSLESTNEPYAIAKIAGIKMCQAYHDQYGCNFISLMPTNLYGPNDNYDLENAHVLPALLRKLHEAKTDALPEVEVWGTGTVRREFLHVDDLADACLFLMNNYDSPQIINVGMGEDLTINELAIMMKEIVGYKGSLRFNAQKPDGTPRKLLDTSLINMLGWRPKITLREGIRNVYQQYAHEHQFVE